MELKLPATVVSQVDVARLLRELNELNDFFVASRARKSGSSPQPPRLTRLLDQVVRDNRYNLLEEPDRKTLEQNLNSVLSKAPLLHMSFASEPPSRALERIVVWLRTNIHPQVLLQVGLQPSIAAGCVLRTPNRWFDMSLRSHLEQQESYLLQLIAGAGSER